MARTAVLDTAALNDCVVARTETAADSWVGVTSSATDVEMLAAVVLAVLEVAIAALSDWAVAKPAKVDDKTDGVGSAATAEESKGSAVATDARELCVLERSLARAATQN